MAGRRPLGLVPSWAKDEKIGSRLINARSETTLEKPAFRTAAVNRRALAPADGCGRADEANDYWTAQLKDSPLALPPPG